MVYSVLEHSVCVSQCSFGGLSIATNTTFFLKISILCENIDICTSNWFLFISVIKCLSLEKTADPLLFVLNLHFLALLMINWTPFIVLTTGQSYKLIQINTIPMLKYITNVLMLNTKTFTFLDFCLRIHVCSDIIPFRYFPVALLKPSCVDEPMSSDTKRNGLRFMTHAKMKLI